MRTLYTDGTIVTTIENCSITTCPHYGLSSCNGCPIRIKNGKMEFNDVLERSFKVNYEILKALK